MDRFPLNRAAAALVVAASLPLLMACEAAGPTPGATASVVAANAPVARIIAQGWQVPGGAAIAPRTANAAGAHDIRAIQPPAAGSIEVSELPPPAAQIAGIGADPSKDAEIETADTRVPAIRN